MLGGVGNGINSPCALAVLSSYKKKRETYIGYFELTSGIAGIIGPIFGSVLYTLGGFKAPFFTIGTLYVLIVGLFAVKRHRKSEVMDILQEKLLQSESEDEKNNDLKLLTFYDIVSTKRSLFGLCMNFIAFFVQSGNIPLLNSYLDKKGYSPIIIASMLVLASVFYALSMPVVLKLYKSMPKRGILIIGQVITSLGFFITGVGTTAWLKPEMSLNNPFSFCAIGIILFGFGFAMITIPVMPEILEGIED